MAVVDRAVTGDATEVEAMIEMMMMVMAIMAMIGDIAEALGAVPAEAGGLATTTTTSHPLRRRPRERADRIGPRPRRAPA